MPRPIEDAINLGPATGARLREVGISTVEKLIEVGWEEAMLRMVERDAGNIHTMLAWALMGAVEDRNMNALSAAQKDAGRRFTARLRQNAGR